MKVSDYSSYSAPVKKSVREGVESPFSDCYGMAALDWVMSCNWQLCQADDASLRDAINNND